MSFGGEAQAPRGKLRSLAGTALSALALAALLGLGALTVVRLTAEPGRETNDSEVSAKAPEPAASEEEIPHARSEPNRLAGESSPYLLLHQYNPVDWYPWGEEALEKARREDKPIFLSVGYSTCYWCHVMERESFSDPAIAELLNRDFVAIKLDREERPDLDEIYMAATQLFTRRGGWPNSVFLTPELEPFYAGTYFPPEDRHGRPGFAGLVTALAEAWKSRRTEIETQADRLVEAMQLVLERKSEPAAEVPPASVAGRALGSLAERFDPTWGGFGGAPKFPTPANLFLLLDALGEHPRAEEMLRLTLDRMARGGMYDQVGGGFHRYSVDARWLVPHFEKMLYDNGSLMEAYALWYEASADPEAARILRETARFLAREMTSPGGAFWSAIDAETDAHEGAFYVWTRGELDAALGRDGAAFLAPIYGFADEPNFEGTHHVLWLPEPLVARAEARGLGREELLAKIRPLLARLLAARAERERPLTDDKVLTSWNGLAIAGLATAGRALGEHDYIERAARAARFLLREMRPKGQPLQHSWRLGEAKIDAYLEDYAYLVHGLLALHRATGDEEWLRTAIELDTEQSRRLAAPGGGFFVAAEDPHLLFRSREFTDNARQAPNAVAVLNLLSLAEATGEASYRGRAAQALKAFAPGLTDHPGAARTLALALRRYHRGAETTAKGTVPAAPPEAPLSALERLAREVVAVEAQLGEADPAGFRPLTVTLSIHQGWHVNANPASDEFLVPTSLESEGGRLRRILYPEPRLQAFPFSEEEIAVYEGEARITAELEAPPDTTTELRLTYQPCDDQRCLAPVTVRLDPR